MAASREVSSFERDGYVVARNVFDQRSMDIYATYALTLDDRSFRRRDEKTGFRDRYPITLHPGDMLVYKGREVPHWRECFDGNYWIQAFFHYVDADGPLASHKFDGRSGIGVLDRAAQ
jgi:hypothetical protein